ncbi:fumarylacetoacetate hydrolase family protein [Ancrocorticia sp.]|uniref:fumarylacetoacetate hydrolase family protein n=1 Tax=Ancrocorticia sp. TaxID=2593684 RepID=UPI003F8DBD81
MRLIRFIAASSSSTGQVRYGIVAGDALGDGEEAEIEELAANDPFAELVTGKSVAELERTGQRFGLGDVRLLAPVAGPSKIVGVGKNYAEHIKEFDSFTPVEPLLFLKPSTAIIGLGDPIILPRWSDKVDHEAELAVVIGKTAKNVGVNEALSYIVGYTVANDVSARDIQKKDGQWTRAKGFDTACPLGPWITIDPRLDPTDLLVTAKVNGDLKQSSSTAAMLNPVAELIAFISGVFTLLPGDVILTGTPAGVSQLHGGDTVEVSVAGVGALTNPVVGEG